MKVALDATPLLGQPTGVGRYVEQLVLALAADPASVEQVLVPITWRGAGGLAGSPAASEPGVTVRSRRAPARPLRELWARLPLPAAELLSGPADVWHGTNFVLPPARRAAGVVTVHDLTYLRHPDWVQPAVHRYQVLVPLALRRAGAVCTPSETVRGELLEAYPWLSADRVFATPLAVATDLLGDCAAGLAPVSGPAPPLPERYVLFLGAHEPRKGLDVLLAAYRLLVAEGFDPPPLVLAGPTGWGAHADLTTLPAGLVRPIGYVPAAEVPVVVRHAAVLAFPSRYEGFGLPPLEALACGVPVVASDLPVLREVLGEHASYAPVGNVQSLAAVLADVLAHEDTPAARGRRRAYAQTFTHARLAGATLQAYRTALSSGS